MKRQFSFTPLTGLRLVFLLACFFVVTGFDACNDDPILDPAGGTQNCHPSYGCSASLAPSNTDNPARF
jgi:hypothetical protein